jgi:hypothetical protein
MSRWVVLKRKVGAVTSQRVLKVLFYVNILQCFFVVEQLDLPVNNLKDLRDFGLVKGGVDPFSPKYRLSSIICDVASFRHGGISFTTSFLLRMLLMLITSIPLLANGIWRNFLLLS